VIFAGQSEEIFMTELNGAVVVVTGAGRGVPAFAVDPGLVRTSMTELQLYSEAGKPISLTFKSPLTTE
jgi:hypothetical protein